MLPAESPWTLQPAVRLPPAAMPWQTPVVIWFLAVIDLVAGCYLLAYARRRDKHGGWP